jgi:hypothetical protein
MFRAFRRVVVIFTSPCSRRHGSRRVRRFIVIVGGTFRAFRRIVVVFTSPCLQTGYLPASSVSFSESSVSFSASIVSFSTSIVSCTANIVPSSVSSYQSSASIVSLGANSVVFSITSCFGLLSLAMKLIAFGTQVAVRNLQPFTPIGIVLLQFCLFLKKVLDVRNHDLCVGAQIAYCVLLLC